MHLEFLVEDQSGKVFLEIALQRIVPGDHTFRVLSYKGIGHIPKNLISSTDPGKRILLDQLPRLLRGYGAASAKYPTNYRAGVIVVCDLDNKDRGAFLRELAGIVASCYPKPNVIFCLAIEEGEAWLMGDSAAIKQAYPNAKQAVLASYVNDSICGTWEQLANAVYPGGAQALSTKGWQAIGTEKARWANSITPHMNFALNRSPSFREFLYSVNDFLVQPEPPR